MASSLRAMAYILVSTVESGAPLGPETTAVRAVQVEVEILTARLALDILGSQALQLTPWTQRWLRDFRAPIGGGTKDIQRNVIGERMLGLPR
jgi:alkylation response protein AidB-like acyl-CoA dehydrogenase